MKNKMFFGAVVLAFLFLMAFANQAAHARTCNPLPTSIDYRGYTIAWHYKSPAIYYNPHLYTSWDTDLTLAAEFDSDRGVWLFYEHVPDRVVMQAHRHWRTHRRYYHRCMGYRADFYYQRYRSHYNYSWYQRQLQSGRVFKRYHHHAPLRYRHHRHRHGDIYTKHHNRPQKQYRHKRNKRHKKKRHHRRK